MQLPSSIDIRYILPMVISTIEVSSFKWRVTVSGELMFLESYGSCNITNTVTPLLWYQRQFFTTIFDK